MRIQIDMTGTTPLLMHSDRGVDPEHPLCREMALITRKTASKRTQEDNLELRRLEWLLGLYTDGERVIYPTAAVSACLREGGIPTREGKTIKRALAFDGIDVPLVYANNGHGNGNVEDLFRDQAFVDVRSVKIGMKRVLRTRPRFMPWQITVTGELFEDIMDLADVRRIANLAGRAVGLGDNRINGFGRFDVEVSEL